VRLNPKEIVSKARIGRLGDRGVMLVTGLGGINVVAAEDTGEILGRGVRPTLARAVARHLHPGIVFDDIAKAEHIDAATIATLLPGEIAETLVLIARQRELKGS
jgi:hypothetical protein